MYAARAVSYWPLKFRVTLILPLFCWLNWSTSFCRAWPLTPAMACQNVMSTSPLPFSASAPGAEVSFGSTEALLEDADEHPVASAADGEER